MQKYGITAPKIGILLQICLDNLVYTSNTPEFIVKMSQLHSLGPYDPATTPAKLAALIDSMPKMQHRHPKVPESYTVKRRKISEQQEEALLEQPAGSIGLCPVPMRYCRNCFSFSRDLAVFSIEQQSNSAAQEEYISWKVRLRDLASAAEGRCTFCSFMACRFFNDIFIMSVWLHDIEQPKPPLGCCTLYEGEVPEVKEAVDRLRSLEEKYPDIYFGFIIKPTDFSLERKSYTKLRFLAANTNTTNEGVMEILGFRRDLTIEIYCLPGMVAASTLR